MNLNNKQKLLSTAGLIVRFIFAILLFSLFVYLDVNHTTLFQIDSTFITNQISKAIDLQYYLTKFRF